MFDYHMHSTVSFDGKGSPMEMAAEAKKVGLKEICFTDHIDCVRDKRNPDMIFETECYNRAYNDLKCEGLNIKKGLEYGLTPFNRELFKEDLKRRNFDFVIGSVHFVDNFDVYYPEFWQNKTEKEVFQSYLEETLKCVSIHNDYDVLGHLTYVTKSPANISKGTIIYNDYKEITDEILIQLVKKGKGMEINTSGVDRIGDFLPSYDFLKRFRELGGEIVTVGSDSHAPNRVGQHIPQALEILKEIFGYVCTYENRQPIFNKL